MKEGKNISERESGHWRGLSGGVNRERLRLKSRRHAQARFGGGQPIPTVVGTPAAL